MKIKQAVILAGGQGTRLRPHLKKKPKPMITIHGKPFLEYVIDYLITNGIKDVLILVGYKHEVIENYFGDGSNKNISIKYSYSPIATETGKRLINAKHLLQNKFLLLYGDNYAPVAINELNTFYEEKKLPAVVTIFSNHDRSRPNNIAVDEKGIVTHYDKSRKHKNLNGVDIGFFILDKKIVNQETDKNVSIEDIIFGGLISKKRLAGFVTHHKYYTLTSPERIPQVKKYFVPKKIILLDRDGVINKKPAKGTYVTSWQQFKFLSDSLKALQLLQKNNFQIFIITNQAGIARGIITKKIINRIHRKMTTALKQNNINIKKIYVCPHGWNENCFCRKPNPGMLFQAASEFNFDLTKVYFVGDDKTDVIAGQRAHTKTYKINNKISLLSIVQDILKTS